MSGLRVFSGDNGRMGIAAHRDSPSRQAYANDNAQWALAGCKIAAACDRQAKRASCYNRCTMAQEAEAQRACVVRTADFLIAFAEAHDTGETK